MNKRSKLVNKNNLERKRSICVLKQNTKLFITKAFIICLFFNFYSQIKAQELYVNDDAEAKEKAKDIATKKNADIQTDDDYKPFNFGLHLKNMHVWHGFVVQSGPMFATNLEFNSRNSKFTFGFWGGASFSGSDVYNPTTDQNVSANYKEFSIYAVYRFSDRFFTELVTHNNFTGVEERGDELHYWSYDKSTSYNFPDLNFGYNFDKLSLYWGIILFGQSQDVEKDDDGNLVRDENGDLTDSWTQYAEIKYTLFEKNDTKLTGFVGGAWSFNTDNTFYTEGKGNVISVGTTLRKVVNLGNYSFPVETTAMWNPEKEITVLQVDLILF